MKVFKFKNPTDAEKNDRFELVDDRGDRLLVREVGVCYQMPIKPTFVLPTEWLIEDTNMAQ